MAGNRLTNRLEALEAIDARPIFRVLGPDDPEPVTSKNVIWIRTGVPRPECTPCD